jgi:hypothetical protein
MTVPDCSFNYEDMTSQEEKIDKLKTSQEE